MKTRVIFLLLGPSSVASSRVRGYWIAEELEKRGVRCVLLHGGKFALFNCLLLLPWCKSLVLQKRCSRWDAYLLWVAKALGKRIVFDIDDKYSRIDHPVTLRNVVSIMGSADVVTAGSSELLAFAKEYNNSSQLLPTSVKLDNYQVLRKSDSNQARVTIGWIGNGKHYRQDLITILAAPLAELAYKYQLTFKLVGACGQQQLYQVFSDIPGLRVELIDTLAWDNERSVSAATADFDIGVYPLLNNDFNRYKCGFKALEYMALGIPTVASPVGANKEIISHGYDGYLADSGAQWITALAELLSSKSRRIAMGRAARNKVEREFDVARQAQTMMEILGL